LFEIPNYIVVREYAAGISNNLPLIYFPIIDRYDNSADKTARVGYLGRVNYSFANKYFLEGSVRRDASYLFAPGYRVGYFPGVSGGWRITEEGFMKRLLNNSTNVLSDLKLRASWGILGDDTNPYDNSNPIVPPYAYLPGYNYNQGIAILDGNSVTVSRDKGVPTTNITWLKSQMTDVGVDFSFIRGTKYLSHDASIKASWAKTE